ncbi:hypothetical protein [uncultured Alistipes sp.]|uniref:hypothetical protein n=1 Tax=uncultured Alistipes sp. TaxID=538949 RepID=UPI0025FBD279|nr:hypothetical protein [uncultured Alistipes sp.]
MAWNLLRHKEVAAARFFEEFKKRKSSDATSHRFLGRRNGFPIRGGSARFPGFSVNKDNQRIDCRNGFARMWHAYARMAELPGLCASFCGFFKGDSFGRVESCTPDFPVKGDPGCVIRCRDAADYLASQQ